jgi:hypothetical protein
MMSSTKPLYSGHRFPPELISYTMWLYFRFPLSLWISVLHGWAGWRKGRPVTLLRILPSCRTSTMPIVATILRGRSDG